MNQWVTLSLTLYFGLFKLVPLYSVTIWKETPFSIFVILLSLQIIDVVLSKGKKLKDKKFVTMYILNILLISFLRNNGIYVVAGTTIILLFAFKNKENKVFRIVSSTVLILTLLLQGPIYNALKINGRYVEKLGVPLQQIGYVITYNGNINEEQLEYLNSIISVDDVKEIYCPWNVDYLKFDCDFKEQIVKNDKAKFFKTWIYN